eukprot:TRINITY_DN10851_c0_g1_i10.p1 TRINITY_DN10851_c0_g1~~TRINITY_DN10851_c0_g1_i10.p1  ORF type:complete len:315 (-),score=22.48 TRINITY_DN10851_c0_g1_i10:32-976(-)
MQTFNMIFFWNSLYIQIVCFKRLLQLHRRFVNFQQECFILLIGGDGSSNHSCIFQSGCNLIVVCYLHSYLYILFFLVAARALKILQSKSGFLWRFQEQCGRCQIYIKRTSPTMAYALQVFKLPCQLPFQGEGQRLSPTPTSTRDSNLPISQPFNSECAGFGKKLGKSGGSSGSGPPYHGSKAELGFRNKQEDRHDERIDYYKPNFAHMAHERIPPMLRGRLPQSQKGVGLQKYRSVSLDIQTQDCDQTLHFFAVYDGHGGEQTSQFCKENLARKLLEIFERNDANGLARSTVQEHQQLEGALINGMVYRCYVQI